MMTRVCAASCLVALAHLGALLGGLTAPASLCAQPASTTTTQPPTAPSGAVDVEAIKRALEQFTPSGPRGPQPQQPPLALTLQHAVDLALANNLGLRNVSLAKESADLEISRARAKFHPTAGVNVSASGSRSVARAAPVTRENLQLVTPFVRQELPTGGSVQFSGDFFREASTPSFFEQYGSAILLTVTQPLLRGGRTYVATQVIENAKFDAATAGAQLRAQMLQVITQATRAYYGALLAEKVIEVTEVAIERDKTLLEASQNLFAARMVTRRDVYSAELILAQDTARLASARGDLDTARNSIQDVLGVPIGRPVLLLDREVRFEPIPLSLERWLAMGLRQRPEIRGVESQLEKSALTIRVARNALLPQLDVAASYGRAQTASQFVKSLELGGDVWSVGAVFSIPLGNVAARAALAQAEIENTQLRTTLSQTKRQVELEVRAAVIKLETNVERIRALTVAIEQARGKLEVGRAQFALGQATNLDITDAQQALLAAETDLLTALVDYNIGLAELTAAVGQEGRTPSIEP
jgi:outer membrane protein TolC